MRDLVELRWQRTHRQGLAERLEKSAPFSVIA